MLLTLPTLITLTRIASLPLVVALFYLPYGWASLAAALLFAAGGITDWLDGWVARRYGLGSAFGAFLDPVADKLAVAVALFLIVQAHASIVITVLATIIVSRELTISALREWMAGIGESAAVKVAQMGKVKTVAQMIALPCLLYYQPLWGIPVPAIGEALFGLAALLTLWSGVVYLKAAWPVLNRDARCGAVAVALP